MDIDTELIKRRQQTQVFFNIGKYNGWYIPIEEYDAVCRALNAAVEQRNKFAELHYGEHWKSKGIQSFMRNSLDAALLATMEEAGK